MTLVTNIVLLVLAGLSFFAVFYFLSRALSARSKIDAQAYEVGRVRNRRRAQVDVLRAVIALLFALIFLMLFAAGPRIIASLPRATATPEPTAVPPTAPPTATETVAPAATEPPSTPTALPATATVTLEPTETATPAPLTATVVSGVGVYLRANPGTDAAELEYLPEGSVVFVLDGTADADALLWQQVRTDAGQVGWVASDFIAINQP